ncbi:MAG: Arm DNA-binding domain-containing protein [Alistipes indistinctus]
MAEYSICKCIRTDKPLKRSGKYPIYLRVRVGFRDTKIPTNFDVFPDQWDKRKNEPRNKAARILSGCANTSRFPYRSAHTGLCTEA